VFSFETQHERSGELIAAKPLNDCYGFLRWNTSAETVKGRTDDIRVWRILLSQEAVYEDLVNAVLSFDPDRVAQVTKKALDLGEDPVKIIDQGLTKALRIVGKKYEDGELFVMHLVAAAEPVQRVIKDILEPEIRRRKVQRKTLGKIVLGTVAGDIHDIGKNIVGAMWFAAGFEIFDIGKDVPTQQFIKTAKEANANIVGGSALLSTSLPMQAEIVKATIAEGLRERFKLVFGGAPVTEQWTKEIGADGYAEDAVEAVKVAKKLLGITG
jgi:corrinoid protein of di/trimethylamine methyltransferase